MNNDSTPKPPALSRTWEVVTVYRECSVVMGSSVHIVTLNRDHTALVNGCPADYERAVKLVHYADKRTVLDEILMEGAA